MAISPLATPTGALDSAGRAVASEPGNDAASDTAVANTAVVRTYTAVPGQRHRLTMLAWAYSAAPTGGNILVQDGASTILTLPITAAPVAGVSIPDGGLQGSLNTVMTVTLAAGGAGVIGTLNTAKQTF